MMEIQFKPKSRVEIKKMILEEFEDGGRKWIKKIVRRHNSKGIRRAKEEKTPLSRIR